MKKQFLVVISLVSIVLVLFLSSPVTKADGNSFKATASLHALMTAIVDPTADEIWDAVGTVATKEGVEERRPKDDAEWAALRNKGLLLVEAGNLLRVKGRHVVSPGENTSDSDTPGVLGAVGIENAINRNYVDFTRKVNGFQTAAIKVLNAIERKDAEELINAGGELEHACEQCHATFWYPNAPKPPAFPQKKDLR
ncbi:MAG TPA: hypothetical protein VFM46_12695 [Pseudomonadales bacterium]|nr:hypothetical protein [Pseudomonadales bacterium]